MLSEAMPSLEGFTGDIVDRRKEVLSDLRSLSVGLDDTLEKTIICGVAFHRKYSHLQEQLSIVLAVLTSSRCWLDY